MFFVYMFGVFAVLAIICILAQMVLDYRTAQNEEGFLFCAVLACFISLCILGVGGIASLVGASNQTYDSVNLAKIAKFESVYQGKADNLTKQFSHYLGEAYPNHEKDIFDKIKPGDVDIYLAKYPELQASKTITELVSQIRSLNDDVYKQQLARAETVRDITFRKVNPWLFQWLIPEVPTEQLVEK